MLRRNAIKMSASAASWGALVLRVIPVE
ncbi:twin-arginine translocation signal domain-containing protein [Ralstonia pickettii]|nr:twin-arginine translocation signal domain-containing protein [Ralstonia pickettii]MBB0034214.1 twin-arginine translocation signal domain-containing protein [Ralstonia pickettii]MBB0096886.1 twin-arginine translocation signal domain-containing protein [Ralstonia pickettii]MBB0106682.1 twin-arginine translocation signal domain-containing protein [Ralstonia pickettii]MBB0126467.1 twin-arginine translocation signal domain-containing protein [Ralstonia pickettii]